MTNKVDPHALASALPGGVAYVVEVGGNVHRWSAMTIAEFQADHLIESGYTLVYDEPTAHEFGPPAEPDEYRGSSSRKRTTVGLVWLGVFVAIVLAIIVGRLVDGDDEPPPARPSGTEVRV